MEYRDTPVKIAVLGQDERLLEASKELQRRSEYVSVKALNPHGDLLELSKWADYIVLPIIGSEIIENLDEAWFMTLKKETTILAGITSKSFLNQCLSNNQRVEEYLVRTDFQIANAVPTAEGAIKLYMEMTRQTVDRARMLVLGFGHCGSALALRLKSLGASVTVFARKSDDLVLGRSMGLDVRDYGQLKPLLGEGKTIFNTVPAKLLDETNLHLVSRDCLIIDLASAPGGTDFLICNKLEIESVLATGLPGKYFPKSSGKILADTIIQMIRENNQSANSMLGGY